MFQIQLAEEERQLLLELLENDITELRGEIADTDRREYREMLKDRELLMKKLQKELSSLALGSVSGSTTAPVQLLTN